MEDIDFNPLFTLPSASIPLIVGAKVYKKIGANQSFKEETGILGVDEDYENLASLLRKYKIRGAHTEDAKLEKILESFSFSINDPQIKRALRVINKAMKLKSSKSRKHQTEIKDSLFTLMKKRWPFYSSDSQTQVFVRLILAIVTSYERKTRDIRFKMGYLENLILNQHSILETLQELAPIQQFIKEKHNIRRSYAEWTRKQKELEVNRIARLKGTPVLRREISLDVNSAFISAMSELWILGISLSKASEWFNLSESQFRNLPRILKSQTQHDNNRWVPLPDSPAFRELSDKMILDVVLSNFPDILGKDG